MDHKQSDNNSIVNVPSAYNEECILYGAQHGDRRERLEPYDDPRPIMKCIGQIKSNYGDNINYCGTGTVYHYRNERAYIITCGHNVVRQNDKGQLQNPSSIKFLREVSKYGKLKEYDAEIIAIHEGYMFKTKDGALAKVASNDLAIIRITDDDNFYEPIFAENSDIINLFCCDNIHDKLTIDYYLYGYPVPKVHDRYSKANDEELWGMKASSYEQKDEIVMFVKKNEQGTQFIYNAIDTEHGQSRSAIFIKLSDGTFGIVGIHTAYQYQNEGVALNKHKIQWINQNTTPIKDGSYLMKNIHSKKVLDVPNWTKDVGHYIIQYEEHGGTNQKFLIKHIGDHEYTIQNEHSGLYLGIASDSKNDGAPLVQWGWNESNDKRWRFIGDGFDNWCIQNVNSGKYMNIPEGKTENDVKINQWRKNAKNEQKFKLISK